jgi:uncharacterized protein
MSITERLKSDVKEALKAGEKLRLSVLRMLQARILEREVELRSERGRDYHLMDEETLEVLAGYAKQRRQSIESYSQGGREDLASREREELAVVESYLPRALSEAEIETVVDRAIEEAGAAGLKDLGTVMKAVMAQVKSSADGKLVNQIVKRRLVDRK